MTQSNDRAKRSRERLALNLPARVTCRETLEHDWMEMTRLLDVTPFGARFLLLHPTEQGRLIHLTMPMPRQLRCFDHVEDQYKVWCLVRHLKLVEAKAGEAALRFEVGVGFVGKRPPASFDRDPTTRYEVSKTAQTGMFEVREMPKETARQPTGKPRPETRLNLPIEVTIEVFDAQGKIVQREATVTENISRRGALVFTTLDVERGRFVRVTSGRSGLAAMAAVRAKRTGADGIPRLHLEFIDREWQLEGLE